VFPKFKVVEQSRKVAVRREKCTPINLPLLLARGRLSEQCGFPLRDGPVAAPGFDGQLTPPNAALSFSGKTARGPRGAIRTTTSEWRARKLGRGDLARAATFRMGNHSEVGPKRRSGKQPIHLVV